MIKNKYLQLILDFTISGLFVFLSMTILIFIIPKGLTAEFLFRGSKLVGFAFSVLSIIFLIFWLFNRNFKFKKKIQFPELKDFLLLALPMSPVLDYVLLNTQYLDLYGLTYLIGITLVFSLFFSFIFPIFFSYIISFKILMISGLALSFTVLTMAKIANNPNNHILNSQFVTQGLYLIISFGVVYLLYFFNKKISYAAVILFMVTGVSISFFNYYSKNSTEVKNQNSDRLTNFLNNKSNKIIKKKNVYILVYESYAGLDTIDHYGFDNTNQVKFLEKNGFKIYQGIYSNASKSLDTTSRVLEIEGKLSKHPRNYTSGNAFGLDIFKANDYKTIGLFKNPYFFGSYPISWDEYYPKANVKKLGGKTITKTIFEGEFKFDNFNESYNYEKYLK